MSRDFLARPRVARTEEERNLGRRLLVLSHIENLSCILDIFQIDVVALFDVRSDVGRCRDFQAPKKRKGRQRTGKKENEDGKKGEDSFVFFLQEKAHNRKFRSEPLA